MALVETYNGKPDDYFNGERRDLIDRLAEDPRRAILEIGCGDGATGAYAKKTGRCGRYVGVELSEQAALIAAGVLDEVRVGDVESMELPSTAGGFDVLIASEVLEHFVDPWSVLRRIHPLMKPGAIVFASSPNVAHRSTLAMLLKGGWDLSEEGRMDRTHLRWFTPRTYAALFENTGYDVEAVWPMRQPGLLARTINLLTGSRLSHLFVSQIVVQAHRR
jgi:2-polyprenyl-3-methyl-5-hydroxy-6-metoxy-1,4-benzoquinol methylase